MSSFYIKCVLLVLALIILCVGAQDTCCIRSNPTEAIFDGNVLLLDLTTSRYVVSECTGAVESKSLYVFLLLTGQQVLVPPKPKDCQKRKDSCTSEQHCDLSKGVQHLAGIGGLWCYHCSPTDT